MKVLSRYIYLILLLISKTSFAQSFVTKVSSTVIGKDDVLQIEYEADNASIEQFTLPDFKQWTVVSGPNMSSSTTQSGNVVKQQMLYSVIVHPNAAGTLTVPGATALIDDKPQRSNSISVQVKNISHIAGNAPPAQVPSGSLFDPFPLEDEIPAAQYLKKGEKATDKIKNNIVIRLEVNKRTCYVGEPILATYKLCTRLRAKSKVVKQPQFSGCTVIELTGEEQDQHVEKINGIQYNVFIIRKVQLMPLAAGALVLPQASVENKISFYNASQLSYRDLYYTQPQIPVEEQLITLQNNKETVEVKALPALPSVGNTDFSGAVGIFDAAVAIKESAITTNSTNHLLFTIEGEGNLQQVKAPAVKWPKGVEAFEATEQTEEDKSDYPVRFRKTFSFPFIVNRKGNYLFSPVMFTYFNAESNRYVTKATHSFTLPVAQGKKTFFPSPGSLNSNDGFLYRLYILLGTALVCITIGLFWYNRKQKKPVKAAAAPVVKSEVKSQEKINTSASEFLYAVRELQPDTDVSYFYKQLSKNLHAYIQNKFGIQPEQLPLYVAHYPEQNASLQQLQKLVADCSLGMYTPIFTAEQAAHHRLEAIEILSHFEDVSNV